MSIRTSLRAAAFVAVAALVAAPLVANAGSSNGTLTVSASVAKNCTIGNSTLAFGSYDPVSANLSTDLNQTSTITLTCTKSNAGTVGLAFGASANAGPSCGTSPARCMLSGSDYLNYQLYSDSNRTAVWTAAVNETVNGGVGGGNATIVTIYGQIPAGQNAAVGASYADSVIATVNF